MSGSAPNGEQPRRGGRVAGWLLPFLFGLGFAIHLWLTGRLTQLDRLLEPLPYAYGDYSLHYYDAIQAAEALADFGRIWTWDPRFMAGYPSSVFDAVSNRTLEMLFWIAPGLPPVVFKAYVVLSLLLPPFLLLLAAHLAGLDRATGLVAALLTLGLLQLDELLFTFVRRGLFQFPFANALAVAAVGSLLALARSPSAARAIGAGGLLGLTLLAHPTMALVLLCPAAAVLFASPLLRERWRTLVLAVGLALVPNLPWLLAVAENLAYLGPDSGFWRTESTRFGQLLFADPGAAARNAIVGSGSAAVLVCGRRLSPYVAGAAVATALGLYGSRLPLVDRLEPARFVLAGAYLAILPAAMAVLAVVAGPRRRRGLAAVGVGLLLLLVPVLRAPQIDPLPNFLRWTMPLEETAVADELVATLQRTTDRGGRILLDQDWPGSYHHGFIACYVGLRLERELIGGPHPFVKLLHNRVNTIDGYFLGERLDDVDDRRLDGLLRLYNVRWLATRRPAAVANLAASSVVEAVAAAGEWRVFRARHDADYFVVGSGRVEVSRNRLRVWSTVAAEPVAVRYHYHPRMRVRGGTGLAPHPVADAPLPFVEVRVESPEGAVIEIR